MTTIIEIVDALAVEFLLTDHLCVQQLTVSLPSVHCIVFSFRFCISLNRCLVEPWGVLGGALSQGAEGSKLGQSQPVDDPTFPYSEGNAIGMPPLGTPSWQVA